MATDLSCLPGLNPLLNAFEEEYGDLTPEMAAALDVAKTCSSYREGTPTWLDVDLEGIPYDRVAEPVTPASIKAAGYTDDDEAAALLALRFAPDKNKWP